MRLLEQELADRWADGSIPRSAKSELIGKFNQQFGYSTKSKAFADLLARKQQPTPDQHQFLGQAINQYWDFYNQPS